MTTKVITVASDTSIYDAQDIMRLHGIERLPVVDEGKLADHLNSSVAVEVLPSALSFVRERLKIIGGKPVLRSAVRKDGPVITDHGNFIIDVDFGVIDFPEKLAAELSCCTGVMEHGIFSFVNEVCVGKRNGKIDILRR